MSNKVELEAHVNHEMKKTSHNSKNSPKFMTQNKVLLSKLFVEMI